MGGGKRVSSPRAQQMLRRLSARSMVEPSEGKKLKAPLSVVVDESVAFLKQNLTEYIFRIPGRKTVIDSLVKRYEKGEKGLITDNVGVEVNDVSSLMKRYLMDTERTIFTKSQVVLLLKHAAKVDHTLPKNSRKSRRVQDKFSKSLKLTMQTLGSESFVVLAKVLNFLQLVAENDGITKMPINALAVCFAPVFFIPHIDDQEVPDRIQDAVFITLMMIQRAETLFPGLEALFSGGKAPETIEKPLAKPRRRRGSEFAIEGGSEKTKPENSSADISPQEKKNNSTRSFKSRSVDARSRYNGENLPVNNTARNQQWMKSLAPFQSTEIKAFKQRFSSRRSFVRQAIAEVDMQKRMEEERYKMEQEKLQTRNEEKDEE